jgi:hypothetical protein
VVHAIHSSIIIYYAYLPNQYLSDIADYGVNYRARAHHQHTILLRKTKAYHLSKTDERAEIFTLLARLLWYLRSGESHVGYLNKRLSNNPLHVAAPPPRHVAVPPPVHVAVRPRGGPIFDTIVVQQAPPEETAPETSSGDDAAGEMDVDRPETPIGVDGEGIESADSISLASVEMEGVEGADAFSDYEMQE